MFNLLLQERSSATEPTPRGSWATFDLRNSEPDALVHGLLDHVDAETVDRQNEARRADGRADKLFALYPPQSEVEAVERRAPVEEPREPLKHRILVQCTKLE